MLDLSSFIFDIDIILSNIISIISIISFEYDKSLMISSNVEIKIMLNLSFDIYISFFDIVILNKLVFVSKRNKNNSLGFILS